MTDSPLYPLRFEPIFQYRLWGGQALARWSRTPPPEGRIGEAWLLSDRDDHPSRVAAGPLRGRTITELIAQSPRLMLGKLAGRFDRFPLLLKFLDVHEMLSVQVHPRDGMKALIPSGETGKTEAWVVLEAKAESRVYAGLRTGATIADLKSLSRENVDKYLASFAPHCGQGVLIEAGTVHTLGDGVVVFEVQENSDVTFRLYDWDHIDPKTGKGRPLQVEQALACVNWAQGAVQPIEPKTETTEPDQRERLIECAHFRLWRLRGAKTFEVGAENEPHTLVCVDGAGAVEYQGADYAMQKGDVMLLPASVGVCQFNPERPITLLEIAVPEPA